MEIIYIIKYIEGALDAISESKQPTAHKILTSVIAMLEKVEKPATKETTPIPMPLATPKKVPGPTHPTPLTHEEKVEKLGQQILAINKQQQAENKPKPWSNQSPQCRDCGTTTRRHMGRGYCTSCYFKNPSEAQKKNDSKPAQKVDFVPTPGSQQDKIDKFRIKETEHISNIEYGYCANPTCHKGNYGKFVKGTGTVRDGLDFCSLNCADECKPEIDIKPLPENTNGEIAQKTRNL